MKFSKEQLVILNSNENVKINAVAGSGKTTTVIAYAKNRPENSRILYLAFNKSIQAEATRKFQRQGLSHVEVKTAHALAFQNIVMGSSYQVKNQSYTTFEIVQILNLSTYFDSSTAFILANHIYKLVVFFCNSAQRKVQELNYIQTIADPDAKTFVENHYAYILKFSRIFLGKMDAGQIDIIHDFYIKKFQLSNPKLSYDYILFDEGQDASAAMLDVFTRQKAIKVIVGDTNQQIYSWRYAINSLEKTNFPRVNLSTSYRFNPDVAALASYVLGFKKHLGTYKEIPIQGKGVSKSIKVKAIIARTNLGLLLKAISYITQREQLQSIYFEGHISSYTYADEGASLYDILNLYLGKSHLIKDPLIKGMRSITELRNYIEQTADMQLQMMLQIVEEYGDKVPYYLNALKKKHVEDRENAEVIFSTVHRSKGMEYDTVQLANDFITEEKIIKQMESNRVDYNLKSKLNEEINLLYVAITRSRNRVYVPDSLFPNVDFNSKHIYKLRSGRAKA